MTNKSVLLGLDVGERRIGVSIGDSIGRLASPLPALEVDGMELLRMQRLMLEQEVHGLVVGLPRNMSGEPTKQTQAVQDFVVRRLNGFGLPVHFQDESVTSLVAEQRLKQRGKPYQKGDIDSEAAAIILQDYLEENHGH